jgi:transketolase
MNVEQTAMSVYPCDAPHTPEMVADLARRAWEFRIQVLDVIHARQTGHLGGAFSAAEILTAFYFHHLRVDPEAPAWPGRDRLLFSKGHACAMLYTVLAHRGFFPVEELPTFRALDSRLQGHPEPDKTPGVEIPAGPLGHGVAIGAGMALAARAAGEPHRVYVVLGDGELNAGPIWEGALVAAKYKLGNLKVVVDRNGVQQTGLTADVLPTEPLAAKWEAFGWRVIATEGHDMARVLDALDEVDTCNDGPAVVIAQTIKGKGVSFMEHDCYWHGAAPTDAQYETARAELREGASRCGIS